MAKLYDTITDELAAFIKAQPLFFVASAPLERDGHVNLSPKGLDCFSILCAWTSSGARLPRIST